MENDNLIQSVLLGDCLELMPGLPDQSIDMILCDLPYGTTACKWDVIIPFEALWKEYKRIIKPNGAIVLTASQPFTTKLIDSNISWFKYEWIWEKEQGSNFQLSKYQPMKVHENICVFGHAATIYNPQGLTEVNIKKSNKGKGGTLGHLSSENKREEFTAHWANYPKSIVYCQREREDYTPPRNLSPYLST
jgi:site-specific DNA-methyltransferase (adenine-specific)